jgi:SsrA-binding protein
VEKISIARNPRARHDYHLLETWEAGLVLTGTEVKSLRDRKASLNEAYAHVRNGEVWLEGMTISHYGPGSYNNPPPARSRKLLLHKREIRKLFGGPRKKASRLSPWKSISRMVSPRSRSPSPKQRRRMTSVKI